MIITAPLVAIEKAKPVVAEKLSHAGTTIQSHLYLPGSTSSSGPKTTTTASTTGTGAPGESYVHKVATVAQHYLPQRLGGKPATTSVRGLSSFC
jgi:hypothetical protein